MHLQVLLSQSQLLALGHLFDIRCERELPERPSTTLERHYPCEAQLLCVLGTDRASGRWLARFAPGTFTLCRASVYREPVSGGREVWRTVPKDLHFTFSLEEDATRTHGAGVCTYLTQEAARRTTPAP